MPTGMGVTDPKFVKGGRKLKKTRHCTIPKTLITNVLKTGPVSEPKKLPVHGSLVELVVESRSNR